MAILQVKGMDNRLYEALRHLAKMENRSISQEVIAIIQEYLLHPRRKTINATREFLKLSGVWEGAGTAEDVIASIRLRRTSKDRKLGLDDVFN